MLSAAPLPGTSLIVKTLKDRRMLVMVTAIQQFRGTRDQTPHLVSGALSCQLMLLLPVGMMGPKSGLSCGAFVPTVPSR